MYSWVKWEVDLASSRDFVFLIIPGLYIKNLGKDKEEWVSICATWINENLCSESPSKEGRVYSESEF